MNLKLCAKEPLSRFIFLLLLCWRLGNLFYILLIASARICMVLFFIMSNEYVKI